jgi:triosephosphate isomerase (TIM)
LCLGETFEEREQGLLDKVLAAQWVEAYQGAGEPRADHVVGSNSNKPLLSVAYEPVWAIGTGKAATAKEAEDAHVRIRQLLSKTYGDELAGRIRILYGGSVSAANASEFFKCPNVDGALVGGASLKPADFSKLCAAGV